MRYTVAARAAMMLFAAFSLSLRADWRDEMFDAPVAIREGVQVRAVALKEPRLMKAYILKVLYNEQEMQLRGLTPVAGPYYKWDDLRKKIEQ